MSISRATPGLCRPSVDPVLGGAVDAVAEQMFGREPWGTLFSASKRFDLGCKLPLVECPDQCDVVACSRSSKPQHRVLLHQGTVE